MLGYMGRTIADPKFDWAFLSVPQKQANDRTILQPRGKGLGGSSIVRTSSTDDEGSLLTYLTYRPTLWACVGRPKTNSTHSKN